MTMQMTTTSRISFGPLRSAGAVFAGLVTVVVLSSVTDAVLHSTGIYPPLDQPQGSGSLAIALAYRTVFTVAAGYLTAWLAPSRKLAHAVWLGAIGMLLGILGAVTMWTLGDQWYPIALVVLAIPSTWVGGWLRVNR
jgi:hypothetical protein